jgi:enoyl-CoA hydratase/carnithine racemase
MIDSELQDGVMVVKLNRGVINALNLELVNRLTEVLGSAKEDAGTQGLVLSSANEKFFSIGFDIPQLVELEQKDFAFFYRAFNRLCLDLYRFPKPTAAAITGHATAGGCILALCCDYRFIAEGKKLMGLNEIKLGVPVPYLAGCILGSVAGIRYARDIIESGDFYRPEQSLAMGLVDQVLPLAQVRDSAREKIKSLGSLSPQAYALIKRNRVETLESQFLAHREEKETLFLACWYSAEARQRLKEAAEKFTKKPG